MLLAGAPVLLTGGFSAAGRGPSAAGRGLNPSGGALARALCCRLAVAVCCLCGFNRFIGPAGLQELSRGCSLPQPRASSGKPKLRVTSIRFTSTRLFRTRWRRSS